MIDIENLSIDLGEFHLRDISLRIHDGEYMVLLGPTGAGKTVLVECIVGIHRPDTGRILIDGRDATRLYPEERNVGFVPQDYALFPNMTVADNVAYGLKARRLPKAEIAERVERMMRLSEVEHLRARLPLNLSGGEKQRVALGRALATEPRVLLLDEPLAALDENLRSELAAELRRVHQAVRGTFLHVCHSFEEAAEVADRVAIINEGRIVAEDTPEQLTARLQGGERISLKVQGKPDEKLLDRLLGIEGVSSLRHLPDGGIELQCALGADRRADIARTVVNCGWGLLELRPIGMSLEEIFLKLTTTEA